MNRRHAFVSIAFAVVAVAAPLHTVRAEPARITQVDTLAAAEGNVHLSRLLDLALRDNPEIKAARAAWTAATHRPSQASALPDPQFSVTHWLRSVETRVGPQENVFSLSQRIPFPGKLGLRGDMAKQAAVAEQMRYEAVRRDVIFKVKAAYYNLYWVDQSLAVLQRYRALLRDFVRAAEERYANGEGIQAEALQSQVELSSILERQLEFENSRSGYVARLNALVDRPAQAALGSAMEVDTVRVEVPADSLIRFGLRERQELKAAHAVIRKNELGRSLAEREYLPDFNVGGAYIVTGKGSSSFTDAGKDAYSVTLGVNLPLWLGRRHAGVEEAEELLHSSQGHASDLENAIAAELKDLSSQLTTSSKTLALYREGLLAQADASQKSALAAYTSGKASFLTLLDTERLELRFQLGYVKELADYAREKAALERALGGRLPR